MNRGTEDVLESSQSASKYVSSNISNVVEKNSTTTYLKSTTESSGSIQEQKISSDVLGNVLGYNEFEADDSDKND